jgi:hypothetical protein
MVKGSGLKETMGLVMGYMGFRLKKALGCPRLGNGLGRFYKKRKKRS